MSDNRVVYHVDARSGSSIRGSRDVGKVGDKNRRVGFRKCGSIGVLAPKEGRTSYVFFAGLGVHMLEVRDALRR
jgi:hypothetical protein